MKKPNKKNKNILFVTSFWPYPNTDGGRNVTTEIFRHLHKNSNVTVLAYIQENIFDVTKAKLKDFAGKIPIYLVKWNRKKLPFCWFKGKSYFFERDFSKIFLNKFLDLIKQNHYDIIVVDKVVPLTHIPYVKKFLEKNNIKTKLVFFSHNIEANLIRDYLRFSPLWRKLILGPLIYLEYMFAKKQELDILKMFDKVHAISTVDESYFKKHGISNIGVYPPAFFEYDPRPFPKHNTKIIKLLSSLSWYPNTQGMMFFLKNVWPIIIKKVPDAKLILASRKTPKKLLDLINQSKGVTHLGYLPVKDVPTFFDDAVLTISPVWLGTGVKLKVLRAFQMNRPLIATTHSLEGLPKQIFKIVPNSNNPEEFANYIAEYLQNFEKTKQLAQVQHKFFEKYLDPSHLEVYLKTKLTNN